MAFGTGSSREISIDVSSSNMKMVLGGYNRKTGVVSVDKFGLIPLESDTIADGVIADQFGVVMALKNALAKSNIQDKRAILTVEGSYLHTRDLELPAVKGDQLRDMVRYEILGQGTNNRDMIVEYEQQTSTQTLCFSSNFPRRQQTSPFSTRDSRYLHVVFSSVTPMSVR